MNMQHQCLTQLSLNRWSLELLLIKIFLIPNYMSALICNAESHWASPVIDNNTHLSAALENVNPNIDGHNINNFNIHECSLAILHKWSAEWQVPLVFLPLQGQIIHPSNEINFNENVIPKCRISESQYLSDLGWITIEREVGNPIPFRLFNDSNRTLLQWLGDSNLRHKLQGKLILIKLLCRSFESISNITHYESDLDGDKFAAPFLFNIKPISTCFTFRVAGITGKHSNLIPEVSYQNEIQTNSIPTTGLTEREYISLSTCGLVFGVVYITSIYFYICVKKRRSQFEMRNNVIHNDVTECAEDVSHNRNNSGAENQKIKSYNQTGIDDPSNYGDLTQNINEIDNSNKNKDNIYILQHISSNSHNLHLRSNLSDNNNRDDVLEIDESSLINAFPSILNNIENHFKMVEIHNFSQDTPNVEFLPEEKSSTVEEINLDTKFKGAMDFITTRRKLYFNPSYFEPQLLSSPPPAANEFLAKIREVIKLAKYRILSKRFQPSLSSILEECSQSVSSTENTIVSEKYVTNKVVSHMRCCNNIICRGCPEYKVQYLHNKDCIHYGDKINSIKKWLEDVCSLENFENKEYNSARNILRKCIAKQPSNDTKMRDISECNSVSESKESNCISSKSVVNETLTEQNLILNNNSPRTFNNNSVQKAILENGNMLIKHIVVPMDSLTNGNSKYYDKMSINSSNIYNNPQFYNNLAEYNCPTNSKVKHRIEVLDQYSRQLHNEYHPNILKNLHCMPDMVYDALTSNNKIKSRKNTDLCLRHFSESDYEYFYNTVDIDRMSDCSGYNKIHNQPDSPIFSRKCPNFFIVDYETDSLERTPYKKYNSLNYMSNQSDSIKSSQSSPSLSSVLPLDEEIEMCNAVYNTQTEKLNHKKQHPSKQMLFQKVADIGVAGNSTTFSGNTQLKVDCVWSNNNSSIKYNTPCYGSMTIEVPHSPTDIAISTDSEQFEPDTLDRKQKKMENKQNFNCTTFSHTNIVNNHNNIDSRNLPVINTDILSVPYPLVHFSLENHSLPDMNRYSKINEKDEINLSSKNSFKSNSLNNIQDYKTEFTKEQFYINKTRIKKNMSSVNKRKLNKSLYCTEEDRILTLEARHSKRQRNTDNQKPPDIIPHQEIVNMYDNIMPSKDSETNIMKQLVGWNTENFNKKYNVICNSHLKDNIFSYDTMSTKKNESIQITSVADNKSKLYMTSQKYKDCQSSEGDRYAPPANSNSVKTVFDCDSNLFGCNNSSSYLLGSNSKVNTISETPSRIPHVYNRRKNYDEIYVKGDNKTKYTKNLLKPSTLDSLELKIANIESNRAKSQILKYPFRKFINFDISNINNYKAIIPEDKSIEELSETICHQHCKGIQSDISAHKSNIIMSSNLNKSEEHCIDNEFLTYSLEAPKNIGQFNSITDPSQHIFPFRDIRFVSKLSIDSNIARDNKISKGNKSRIENAVLNDTKLTKNCDELQKRELSKKEKIAVHFKHSLNGISNSESSWSESSSETDFQYNTDDLDESGAESVETHSVLFKNTKNGCNTDKVNVKL